MYIIEKVLNNNTLLTTNNDEEVIFLGRGIGFGKKTNDHFIPTENCQEYHLIQNNECNVRDSFLKIDPLLVEATTEIMCLIKSSFDNVDENIFIPLLDHIDFALKRLKDNIDITNPFTKDIELLFPDEYEIAIQSKSIIENKTHYSIPNDEVGFITLHIHSAVSDTQITDSIQVMEVIHNNIEKLRNDLKLEIKENSIAYVRLLNHMKFLLIRLNTHKNLEMDISDFTKNKFPFAHIQATNICHEIEMVLGIDIPESEIGYLALHIERIISIELEQSQSHAY